MKLRYDNMSSNPSVKRIDVENKVWEDLTIFTYNNVYITPHDDYLCEEYIKRCKYLYTYN